MVLVLVLRFWFVHITGELDEDENGKLKMTFMRICLVPVAVASCNDGATNRRFSQSPVSRERAVKWPAQAGGGTLGRLQDACRLCPRSAPTQRDEGPVVDELRTRSRQTRVSRRLLVLSKLCELWPFQSFDAVGWAKHPASKVLLQHFPKELYAETPENWLQ